jgi:hypothetical protein
VIANRVFITKAQYVTYQINSQSKQYRNTRDSYQNDEKAIIWMTFDVCVSPVVPIVLHHLGAK